MPRPGSKPPTKKSLDEINAEYQKFVSLPSNDADREFFIMQLAMIRDVLLNRTDEDEVVSNG